MSSTALYLYHRLPPPLKNLVATAKGYQLKRWRFGPESERLVVTALKRDCWSEAQWHSYREDRLARVLNRAATQVPFYREQWLQRRRHGDNSSWESLENWPILEKEEVRRNPMAFVADDADIRAMYHEHTSGTTGTSLSLWWSKRVVREWYALFEARWRKWYGVDRSMNWAILGGQLVTPVSQRKPPYWVWNGALKQLYMSSYHLSADRIQDYLDALDRYEIEYIYCYTSSAYALALGAKKSSRPARRLKVVVTNAEPVFKYQRELISDVFDCPVRETYGMSEIVTAAGECNHGRLHLWPEVGITEVACNNKFLEPGVTGDLICTGLLNEDMPLIRYRVGDRGSLEISDETCACGRTLPVLEQIEGRIDDVLYTVDGRVIGRLDPVFKADLPVQEAQIVQERLDLIRVRYVPGAGFTEADRHSIAARLRDRMGNVKIEFDELPEVPRTAAGKFRAVINNMSAEELARIGR
ncbi:MAG: CapK protein [Chloroflexi bacterium OLB13]|nr:MAG: CapK protein [Chloroflexi bacterium OLB13]